MLSASDRYLCIKLQVRHYSNIDIFRTGEIECDLFVQVEMLLKAVFSVTESPINMNAAIRNSLLFSSFLHMSEREQV